MTLSKVRTPMLLLQVQDVARVVQASFFIEYFLSFLRHPDRKRPLSNPLVKSYGYQMLNALSYVHERGIFHRDIKVRLIEDRGTYRTEQSACSIFLITSAFSRLVFAILPCFIPTRYAARKYLSSKRGKGIKAG
jgi:serine/threonine protein kinase